MEMSLNLAHASLIFRPVSLHCLPGEKSVFIARSSRRKSTGSLYVFFFFLSLSFFLSFFFFSSARDSYNHGSPRAFSF